MLDTPIYKGRPPAIHNLDDYRRGLENRPNEVNVETTDHHKVDLCTFLPTQMVPRHVHPSSETVLIVVDGRGELIVGNSSYEMSKGSLTVVPPGADHSVRNTGPDALVLVAIQGPGPFETKVEGSEGKGRFF